MHNTNSCHQQVHWHSPLFRMVYYVIMAKTTKFNKYVSCKVQKPRKIKQNKTRVRFAMSHENCFAA